VKNILLLLNPILLLLIQFCFDLSNSASTYPILLRLNPILLRLNPILLRLNPILLRILLLLSPILLLLNPILLRLNPILLRLNSASDILLQPNRILLLLNSASTWFCFNSNSASTYYDQKFIRESKVRRHATFFARMPDNWRRSDPRNCHRTSCVITPQNR
jgi:hypothetical protein